MITDKLRGNDEKTKNGDDYAARMYVISKNNWLFWNTKAICYVWSNSKGENINWPNPYAPNNVKMMSVSSSLDKINTWYSIRRNVHEDFRSLYGESINSITEVAIMTDTDNTHQKTTAFYKDISFSEK